MEVRVNAARRPNRAGPTNAIRRFFANNPDEGLSTKDIEVKFGISLNHAHHVARRLCAGGELVARREGRLSIYRRAT